MKKNLSRNAFENYDLWAREFETDYEDFRLTLNRWRLDRQLLTLMEQQLSNFDRANPKPLFGRGAQGNIQQTVINRYTDEVTRALKSIIRKQKSNKPPIPMLSASQRSPERGLAIFTTWFSPQDNAPTDEVTKPPRRTQAVVEAETIPSLSVITPRDAVLKNFQIFSDVWALALAWDYASYILLLAFLFFPSAERAAQYKD